MPAGRIAYVDGRYVAHGDANVHIEDRGLQFSDAVYEVCAVLQGHLLDEDAHLTRLKRSLDELGIDMPMAPKALQIVMREMVRRNRFKNGLVYLQVTRGIAKRDHAAPDNIKPLLILTARAVDFSAIEARRAKGVSVISAPDQRWGRRDIKSTSLLPNILAKTKAKQAGAYEAWLVDDAGFVTEGASTNAWIVTKDNVVHTRHLSQSILPGVTRSAVMRAVADAEIRIEEKPFTLEEALVAREAFVTAATAGVMPVIRINGTVIGAGKPGPVALKMQALYRVLAEREAHVM